MNSSSFRLPAFSEIEAALRKTTETLAGQLAAPTSEAPSWTEFEWDIARAVVGMHGISALLYDRMPWKGPERWQQFLREQRHHSAGRYLKITEILQLIDVEARRVKLSLTALKGAALYANGIYAAGERPMGDIDLLVRPEDVAGTAQVLEKCGFEAAYTSRRHQVFQPRATKVAARVNLGEHLDNPIKIEVHTRIVEPLPVEEVDISEFVFPHITHAGLNAYPSLQTLMMHLLLHAAGNIRSRALRLIQLHDIALLGTRFRSSDWAEFLEVCAMRHTLWWVSVPVALTARYYPSAIPSFIVRRLARDCPRLLRAITRGQRVTDISWSNIRIAAFPGLAWSRTAFDAIQFMHSRVWPSQEARQELKEGAAQIPDSSVVPWYNLPHGARILRWVFLKTPRVQTLLSVRAALDHENQQI